MPIAFSIIECRNDMTLSVKGFNIPCCNVAFCQRCVVRGLVRPCAWHHGSTLFIRSLKRLHKERERHVSCVWHPYSPIKYYWDCMQLFFVFAVFLYMPVQVFITCNCSYLLFINFLSIPK